MTSDTLLQDDGDHSQQPHQEKGQRVINNYLLYNVKEFQRLIELREQGWNNPEGDIYFQKQRQYADNANEKRAVFFYDMMKNITQGLQRSTGALAIPTNGQDIPSILDLRAAPGDFLAKALSINPTAHALALSLPISLGGHKVLLRKSPKTTLRFLDITMLAADMGITNIPTSHPDTANFLPQQFKPGQLFHLVLCDGQVLRTHPRAPYREKLEARRLTLTQLALGLSHFAPGGTMIVLLHRVEAVDSVSLLHTFAKFADVRLFKPAWHHAKRSSFYMVATRVESRHFKAVEAVEAVRRWKKQWEVATFGTDAEHEEEVKAAQGGVEDVLGEFGARLVELGREVWGIERRALERAPFIRRM